MFLAYATSVFAQSTEIPNAKVDSVLTTDLTHSEVSDTIPIIAEEIPKTTKEEVVFDKNKDNLPKNNTTMSAITSVNSGGDLTSVDGRDIKGANSLTVDENSGSMVYSYPFTLPKGRGNITPVIILILE